MAEMVESSSRLADLAAVMTVLPQELINVRVTDKHAVATAAAVTEAVSAAAAELGDGGRILLRPSGTEQLVRVMVEAPTPDLAHTIAARVADVVETAGA